MQAIKYPSWDIIEVTNGKTNKILFYKRGRGYNDK